MNFRRLSGVSSFVSRRNARLKNVNRVEKRKHLEFFVCELEKRQLLATTSFSAGLLTINLDAINETLTLTNDGSNITITSTAAITGAGSSFATSGITSLSVTDTGTLADQSLNFGVGSAFAFTGNITISGVESVQVNSAISVSGSSQISVTGADTIQTAGSITTAGGALSLVANADIAITQPILTNGGVQTLTADSDNDTSGSLSLNFAITELVDPNPNTGNQFGSTVLVLTSGNVVVTSPFDDAGATDAGAVYLFNGFTGQLISTLTGSTANDQIGSGGVTALSNGNYVVRSVNWDNGNATDAGAVTWASGIFGVSGEVTSTNSLVGSTADDRVGNGGVTALTNGNYVVSSPNWQYSKGAVTWGSGNTGITGNVTSINSLVGLVGYAGYDAIGGGGVTALTNGNYVVSSPYWNNGLVDNAGAVTWGNGTTGITGLVSSTNSLVGTSASDLISNSFSQVLANGTTVTINGVTALSNGNFVVISRSWDNGGTLNAGAVTWGDGTSGITGNVTASNSLVGTSTDDQIGYFGVSPLTNGNYVVNSPKWDGLRADNGAVTWGNGTTGTTGNVSSTNSLVGTSANDQVGYGGITTLSNGNYVVISHTWDNAAVTDAGAVTWCDGATGTSGNVSSTNSLVGTTASDQVGSSGVTALTNGNYVVKSINWDNANATDAGAVTWGNGTTGVSGNVSLSNSLVGITTNDKVGFGGVTPLTNGNYVVRSPKWGYHDYSKLEVGAVTWGNGTTGITGEVSTTNSLYGTSSGDEIGSNGVTALSNGNYVVISPRWNNSSAIDAGAATWGDGTTGITGFVSATNSLVGTRASDFVGYGGVTALSNGNYVVISEYWDNGAIMTNAGAVTWGNGTTGITGNVTSTNSLVGESSQSVGSGGVTALTNGNYAVISPNWNNLFLSNAGAVTWGNGTTGITGFVSITNSAVGNSTDSGSGLFISNNSGLNTFYFVFKNDGGGRVLAGTQNSGFSNVSGSLNSGGGSISLQANQVNVQTSVCTTMANTISLTANSLSIGSGANVNSTQSGSVTIRSLGASVDLGGVFPNLLSLTQAELNQISTGILTINSNTTGLIYNTAAISWPTNLTLISNQVSQSGGGKLTVAGISNFEHVSNLTGGSVYLNNLSNNFNSITGNMEAWEIADANALTLGNIASKYFLNIRGTELTVQGNVSCEDSIALMGTNLNVQGNINVTSSGCITLVNMLSTSFDLGSKSAGNFGITQAELNNITAGDLTFAKAWWISGLSSDLVNTAPISWPGNLTLYVENISQDSNGR